MRMQKGFTIIEILIVLMLVGILVAISLEAVRGQVLGSALREADSQLVADLEQARSSAFKTSQDSVFTLAADGKSYTLKLAGQSITKRLPNPVTMTISGTSTPNTFTYSAPYGTVSAVGATLNLSVPIKSKTLYLLGVTGKVIE